MSWFHLLTAHCSLLTPFYLCLGLAFGSFANVYFYRVPNGLSLWKPNSFCPGCQNPIQWYDNIPILSYLLLKGQCRSCKSPISCRYPLVEAVTAFLFLVVAFKFRNAPVTAAPGFLWLTFFVILMSGIDWSTFFQFDRQYGIIPDHLIWLIAAGGLIFLPFNPLLKNWWQGLAGGSGAFLFMFLFRWAAEKILKKEALGMGDVKFIGVAGLWLGAWGTLLTVLIGSTLGSLVSLFLISRKKLKYGASVPFGPFLGIGAICALLYL